MSRLSAWECTFPHPLYSLTTAVYTREISNGMNYAQTPANDAVPASGAASQKLYTGPGFRPARLSIHTGRSTMTKQEYESKPAGLIFVMLICLFFATGVTARESAMPTWQPLTVVATAYCPCERCCGAYADGVTAIGRDAFTPGVAVDRSVIPLKSHVNIPGYGTVMADDVGGAIRERRIDVRFSSHQAALEWGRKTLTIYVKARSTD